MPIPLDQIELPTWLIRVQRQTEIAEAACDLVNQMEQEVQQRAATLGFSQPIQSRVSAIESLLASARDAQVQESAIVRLENLLLLAALDPDAQELTSLFKLKAELENAADALVECIGVEVKGQGPRGVRLAIVGRLYSIASNSAICKIDEGAWFGISDHILERYVLALVEEDIFENAGGPTLVRLTEQGRQWFETEVGAAPVQSANAQADNAVAEVWPELRAAVDHLSFITDATLRKIAEESIHEIQRTLGAKAWLATMIVCGTWVETLMLAAVEMRPGQFKFAETKNWEDKVSIAVMVKELVDLKLLKASVGPLMIGDHRDLVHPNRQRKSSVSIRVDAKAAMQMVLATATVAHDLYEIAW